VIRLGRRIRTVCLLHTTPRSAGRLTLRCPLNAIARRLRRKGSLTVRVRTYFTPGSGRPTAVERSLRVARLSG
jgi:hypothetical protein